MKTKMRNTKKVLLFMCILALAVAAFGCAGPQVKEDQIRQQQIAKLLQKGNELLQKGDLEGAIANFQEILNPTNKLDPNNFAAIRGLDTAKRQRDEIKRQRDEREKAALKAYAVVGADISSRILANSLVESGIIQISKGDPNQGLNYFNQALKVDPNCDRAWLNLAAYWHQFAKPINLDRATECYQNCIRINPQNAECRRGLGRVFYDNNKLVEAVEQLETAKNLNPRYWEARYDLGNTYILMGKSLIVKGEGELIEAQQIRQQSQPAAPSAAPPQPPTAPAESSPSPAQLPPRQ